MRIAYICADYGVPVLGGKGGSVHIQQMVRAFAALGHEVTLYCTRLGDGDLERIPATVVEVERTPLAPGRRGTVAALLSERLGKELGWIERAKGVEQRVLKDHATRPFDLVYERYSLWSRAGVTVSRAIGIPCIVEVNAPLILEAANFREIEARAEAEEIEADVFAGADVLIAVSSAVAGYIRSKGASDSRIHVVPNGVDLVQFAPAASHREIPGLGAGRVIGFVGGLKPWHGLQELLAAFRNVSGRYPDTNLMIVGDGPMRGWIEGYLAGTALTHRAVMPGWVRHEDLPGYIHRIDVATAPYPAIDGFYFSPLKLFEYMSAGRPIVASRIGQIGDIIRHRENGLLIRPGKVDDLTAALDDLLRDADLAARLGNKARDDVRAFSWLENARTVLGLAEPLRTRTGHLLAEQGVSV